MAEIEGLVRALGEGDDAAKTAAAGALYSHAYGNVGNKAAIAEAGGIPPLVDLLRDGSMGAKEQAAAALGMLALTTPDNNRVAIVEAGVILLLVELLRDGSADAKRWAAWTLGNTASNSLDTNPNTDTRILIAEAGGVPPLVQLLRDGSVHAKAQATRVLGHLAYNNDGNAIAIAVAVGFEALVQLARRGRVNFEGRWVLDAGVPAKRKAALVVATLLRDSVPDSVPDEMKALIAPYL